jgi:hypothetical protein
MVTPACSLAGVDGKEAERGYELTAELSRLLRGGTSD